VELTRNIELAEHIASLQRQIQMIDRLCREGHIATNGNALCQHLQQLLDELKIPAMTAAVQCAADCSEARRIPRSKAVT